MACDDLRITPMTGTFVGMPTFPKAARDAVADPQLRRNLAHATSTIRAKRAAVVAEVDDWEEMRLRGAQIKDDVLAHLDDHLLQLEEKLTAAEANAVVVAIASNIDWDGTPPRSSRSSPWPPRRSSSTGPSSRPASTSGRPTSLS